MSLAGSARLLPCTSRVVPSSQRLQGVANGTRVSMRKRDIHPKYYEEAKVFCKGEHVLTVSGTQDEYHVEIWSGNHPLYQGKQTASTADDGPLSKFNAKYAGMEDLMTVPSLGMQEVEGLDAFKKKSRKPKN